MYALIITDWGHLASPLKMSTLVLLMKPLYVFVCKGLIILYPR